LERAWGVVTAPLAAFAVVLLAVGLQAQQPASRSESQDSERATFRSGVEMVTINAVVRDHKGRVVPNLTRADFELLDSGRPQKIKDFRADQAPITVALLFDTSGSMQVAAKSGAARTAADQFLAWLQADKDQVAVFSFDSSLRELQGFTRDKVRVRSSFGRVEEPFGMTSLRDAVAETARRVADHGGSHRGVIVFTDGVDNNSRLTPAEVSGIASSIDVPVYVVAVVSPLDHLGQASAVVDEKGSPTGELMDLAQWTGGDAFMSSTVAQSGQAVKQIVDELRFQYLIAFEPGGKPGWHPLEVKLRDRHLSVRARGGYFAGPSSGS
jgi:Ca-activated chloride channel homolog